MLLRQWATCGLRAGGLGVVVGAEFEFQGSFCCQPARGLSQMVDRTMRVLRGSPSSSSLQCRPSVVYWFVQVLACPSRGPAPESRVGHNAPPGRPADPGRLPGL